VPLPPSAVVIAANGGSDYLDVPSGDPALVKSLVTFLQSREEYGAIFVKSSYGAIPGTLSLASIRLEDTAAREPDIVVSFDFDESASVQGVLGTELVSMFGNRGMHGSFSPFDVHNTLIAAGPDFTPGFVDPLPTGNVDVAPTVAQILGRSLPAADGRPLLGALLLFRRSGGGVRGRAFRGRDGHRERAHDRAPHCAGRLRARRLQDGLVPLRSLGEGSHPPRRDDPALLRQGQGGAPMNRARARALAFVLASLSATSVAAAGDVPWDTAFAAGGPVHFVARVRDARGESHRLEV
jgi:hypothetical protein